MRGHGRRTDAIPEQGTGNRMTPPKCRSCGVAEWNHTCARDQTGKAELKVNRTTAVVVAPKRKKKRERKGYHRDYYDSVRRARAGRSKRKRVVETQPGEGG